MQDRDLLLRLATSTGLFTTEDAEWLLGKVLDGLHGNILPSGHQAFICRSAPGQALLGWSYFAPDQHAANVWNLWWIGVSPSAQGAGAGAHLLRHAERTIASLGGRLLVIETSDLEITGRARRFYAKEGYSECGRIPDFYSEGEAKVIFARRPRAD